jgi:hypothetical protein
MGSAEKVKRPRKRFKPAILNIYFVSTEVMCTEKGSTNSKVVHFKNLITLVTQKNV